LAARKGEKKRKKQRAEKRTELAKRYSLTGMIGGGGIQKDGRYYHAFRNSE